jgi:uncharacterized protein (TIGR03790 family)
MLPIISFGGGSGLNTLVVANAMSSNSLEVANYYLDRRQVPREQLLPIYWSGGNTNWSATQFSNLLLHPLRTALTNRGLAGQIQFVVLSMDIPFQTGSSPADYNSTTAALYYGLQSSAQTNAYARAETAYDLFQSSTQNSGGFLTMMLTGDTVGAVKAMIDQGVSGDGRYPPQQVVLAKTTDPLRNLRASQYRSVEINAEILGRPQMMITNSNDPKATTNTLGYATGLARFSVATNAFVPGAIADSLTSFGGIIFGPNDQTNLLEFIKGGATASYGTVAEPGADASKFPGPQVYFYQGRGFSAAESYYQSIVAPYLGLMVGEPLTAPFASPGSGSWGSAATNGLLSGVAPLEVSFRSPSTGVHRFDRADLFVNGKFHSTLTNFPPAAGNSIRLQINGYPLEYVVPTNATIGSLAGALAALINNSAPSHQCKITAQAHGDRVELLASLTNNASPPYYLTITHQPGIDYSAAYLPESQPPQFLGFEAKPDGAIGLQLALPTPLPYSVEASTNLQSWQSVWASSSAGLEEFVDTDAPLYDKRFYRIAGPVPDQPPQLTLVGVTNGNHLGLRATSLPRQGCAVLASSNLTDWIGVVTNSLGGVFDYQEPALATTPARFYRAVLVTPPAPTLTLISNLAAQDLILQVTDAVQPYSINLSTNGTYIATVTTNFGYQDIALAANVSAPGNDPVTTVVYPGKSYFVFPETFGQRTYSFFSGTLTTNAWGQFKFTKTNAQSVSITLTNQVAGANPTNLAFAFYTAINTNPDLQGPDGVVAEDFGVVLDQAQFILRARTPGYPASQIRVETKRSSFGQGFVIVPPEKLRLDENLDDLLPRNHLYIQSGAGSLGVNFPFDTTTLPDGHHELTAVAYEGSHVRTQTRSTVSVCVSNSPLVATLTLLNFTNPAPVYSGFDVQVTANTNSIAHITLFSTGGALASVTNQSTALFQIAGTNLWIGRHPLYALVETVSGQKYRTPTSWIRLQ